MMEKCHRGCGTDQNKMLDACQRLDSLIRGVGQTVDTVSAASALDTGILLGSEQSCACGMGNAVGVCERPSPKRWTGEEEQCRIVAAQNPRNSADCFGIDRGRCGGCQRLRNHPSRLPADIGRQN
jgi:hypothetical protein